MKAFRFHRMWLLVVAILWVAASSHSLARSTSMMFSNLGDSNHPALVSASEAAHHTGTAHEAATVVVDAATFWASVDEYDCCSGCQASCASVSVAIATQPFAMNFLNSPQQAPVQTPVVSRSFIPTIDTPPPRTH
ncbi:MAG: hypothetical protein EAZ30_07175 [Betaproteobacteria bacterium]|nr:MAG: hypothetical protein EAZ30_07175 [Betaproteobacteria bacterium]